MARKPSKLMIDVNGMLSRLIIERCINDYGNPSIGIRWGGTSHPVIVLEHQEARELYAAIGRMINVA